MRASTTRGAVAACPRGLSSPYCAADREIPHGRGRLFMAYAGWSSLIPSKSGFQGPGAFRIDAYSEYMPPPRVGWKPYGPVPVTPYVFQPDDPFGWQVHEFDEAL